MSDPRLDAETLAALEDHTTHLPLGRTGGPEVRPYSQHAGPSCFYASLIAIQATYAGGPPVDEFQVVNAARRQGLLVDAGPAGPGADHSQHLYGSQTDLVREMLGLDIEFTNPLWPVPIAERLVQAMIEKDHAVFG